MRVLILGANGFIGYHLVQAIGQRTDWSVIGFDIRDDKISQLPTGSRLEFRKGDIRTESQWIEKAIERSDVVLPLIAIATPATYIKEPLRVYELDFEENIKIIKMCVKHKKRIIFPSTSEVYGMSNVSEFNEDESNLVVGPICKQRWIYSSCKQLLDRVIWAYGKSEGLRFSIFRPFNWIGPHLDNVKNPEDGSSRVLTQFISNIVHGKEIKLVNGGKQHRCFTYIDDGIDCLLRIVQNKNGIADGQIFNIGNPDNNFSIEFLAQYIAKWVEKHRADIPVPEITYVSDKTYYGEGFEDVSFRVPSIAKARALLSWEPKYAFEAAVDKTLEYYFSGEGLK